MRCSTRSSTAAPRSHAARICSSKRVAMSSACRVNAAASSSSIEAKWYVVEPSGTSAARAIERGGRAGDALLGDHVERGRQEPLPAPGVVAAGPPRGGGAPRPGGAHRASVTLAPRPAPARPRGVEGADHAGGVPDRDHVGRQVARHDGARADHGVVADRHPRKHDGAAAEPHVVPDRDGLRGLPFLPPGLGLHLGGSASAAARSGRSARRRRS